MQHWASERESRHKNLQLESQVKTLLNKYDQEMYELHEKIQELENKYSKEKTEFVSNICVKHVKRCIISTAFQQKKKRDDWRRDRNVIVVCVLPCLTHSTHDKTIRW